MALLKVYLQLHYRQYLSKLKFSVYGIYLSTMLLGVHEFMTLNSRQKAKRRINFPIGKTKTNFAQHTLML